MPEVLHATCVAIEDKGLLITGASGSGKSRLALQLMAFGAELVADDRTQIEAIEGRLIAMAVPTIEGLIEARGVGILNAVSRPEIAVTHVVDMDRTETERLPLERNLTLMGQSRPLFYKVEGIHFAASLWQLMRHGRSHR